MSQQMKKKKKKKRGIKKGREVCKSEMTKGKVCVHKRHMRKAK